MLKNVHVSTLTPLMLKQLRGMHGQINFKCSICKERFTEKDVGNPIVSFISSDASKRKKIAKSHAPRRDYVHGHCFNRFKEGLWHEA